MSTHHTGLRPRPCASVSHAPAPSPVVCAVWEPARVLLCGLLCCAISG